MPSCDLSRGRPQSPCGLPCTAVVTLVSTGTTPAPPHCPTSSTQRNNLPHNSGCLAQAPLTCCCAEIVVVLLCAAPCACLPAPLLPPWDISFGCSFCHVVDSVPSPLFNCFCVCCSHHTWPEAAGGAPAVHRATAGGQEKVWRQGGRGHWQAPAGCLRGDRTIRVRLPCTQWRYVTLHPAACTLRPAPW